MARSLRKKSSRERRSKDINIHGDLSSTQEDHVKTKAHIHPSPTSCAYDKSNVWKGKDILLMYIFQLTHLFYVFFATWFYDFTISDIDNLPTNTPFVTISHHTTHSGDIMLGIHMMQETSGILVRALIHRIVYATFPISAYFGCVPGERKTALALLAAGESVGCVPGGGEELAMGHDHAYTLHW